MVVPTSFPPAIGESTLLLAGVLILYLAFVVIYRLTLHPLAKYPGPLFNRLSGWSLFFQALNGDRHLESWKEHETYGPIVRIAPNALSINTIAGLRAINGDRNANVKRGAWYLTIDYASEACSVHTEMDIHKHAFRRRVLEHAFSESALRSAERFVHENVARWLEYLGKGSPSGQWTPAKNMAQWCTYLGFDVMGDLTFGRRFDCIGSDENRYIPKLMMDSGRVISFLGYLPCITLARPFLKTRLVNLLAGEMSENGLKFVEYANNQMVSRISAEKETNPAREPRKDFVHYLVNAKDPLTGKGLTTAELNSDSSTLISAGSDTVAITLSATIFYLLHYPDALEKLTAQIRSAFSSIGQIDGKAVRSDVYLRACIDEALRLSPPVASHLPREVLPGGLTVDGHHFAPGTTVGTPTYAIHHNPEYYPDPFKYRPERWIADESVGGIQSPDSVATARAAFCPFNVGRRGCVGKNIAYLELHVALAKLLYMYDLRLPEGKLREPSGEGVSDHENPARRRRDEYQFEDRFVAVRDGPMVEFKRRQGVC